MLLFWVQLKTKFARLVGWIHPLVEEVEFVKNTFECMILNNKQLEKLYNLRYVQDKLLWFIPWDYMWDSITFLHKKYGDCGQWNRLIQMMCYTSGYKNSYLVTYTCKPFRKSHITCVIKSGDFFYSFDYGYKSNQSDSLFDCVNKIAKMYNVKLKKYVVQDVNFNIVTVK